jgi:hypothetical protein
MTIGYDKPLYVLPFDHRATFSKNMFGWQGQLSPEQATFWEPLVEYRAKKITRDAASYREWVDLFEKKAIPT